MKSVALNCCTDFVCVCDADGVDSYPFINTTVTTNLTNELDQLDALHAAFGKDPTMGLVTVSQAFDKGAECATEAPHCPSYCCGGQMPSYATMRAMSMLHMVRGSGGLLQWTYCKSPHSHSGCDVPSAVRQGKRNALRRIGLEVRNLSSVFLRPSRIDCLCSESNVLAALFEEGRVGNGGGTVVAVNVASVATTALHCKCQSPSADAGGRDVKLLPLPPWGVVTQTLPRSDEARQTRQLPPCHGACARAALTAVCGGGWTGPDDDQTFVHSMMVSRPTCVRCASQHGANLTATGVGATDIAAVCAALPTRWNPLADLAPLAKIHHAVPYCRQNPTGKFSGCVRNDLIGVNEYLDSEDPVQLDMARITRAVPLDAAFGVPGSLYAGCYYNSCFHNKTEVVEAVKLAAKSNASLGITYDPWSQFWSSDPSVLNASGTGKTTGTCCE